MSAPIVDIQQLKKTYHSWSLRGRCRVNAVRGVSLQAYAGEVFGLLGPNGAGKTTLIKMLLGVVQPSAGTATLFGQAIGSSAARRRVGYLPESLRVDRHHTARSALQYYGRMSRMDASTIRSRSDELLKLVGLEGRDRESVKRFSKGMYQRLGLAQALLHDPDLLVLDEPTDGLDPVGRNEVRKVIDRLRESGKTIFLNSHILQEVELVCTRVAILARGEIKAVGALDELSASDHQQLIIDMPAQDDLQVIDESQKELATKLRLGCDTVCGLSNYRGLHRLSVEVESQQQIDFVVDQLRQQGRSIARLVVKKESLEETFMRLVGTDEGGVS
ncbi:ABC transporter ATP-binding protein [Stieleria sp. JC731]|uniref:ABC transporter ATP-binding protein n=1 Tax=Pirellulaceae TaxID=2691357 RepID=UPI001E46D51C|nr:ABC transporter ATP-binding protein [Stieleria sp. JC731]MCC9599452.1 ABC transporter ATP-binding protein [Stieleria sp. JC731]